MSILRHTPLASVFIMHFMIFMRFYDFYGYVTLESSRMQAAYPAIEETLFKSASAGVCFDGKEPPVNKPYFKYILSLLMFGTNGIVASHIALTSYEIVLFRALIGSLLLIAIFFLTKQSLSFHHQKRPFFYLALSGAAMGASWMFLYEAYQQIGVSIASLMYYCGPVILMALSPVLFKEKMAWPKLVGFMIVFCGVFLVNVQLLHQEKTGWGLFCGGMSAVTYAVMVIFNKKAKGISGLENSMLQLFTAFLTVAFFMVLKQGLAIQVAAGDWLPILWLGLLNTGIGCYLYFSSIGHLPVQTVSILGYLELLSAVVFSILFLNEALQPLQRLGAALILGGAVFGECAFAQNATEKPSA
jgi:drug/metabolite transporter (DMT)-like permease